MCWLTFLTSYDILVLKAVGDYSFRANRRTQNGALSEEVKKLVQCEEIKGFIEVRLARDFLWNNILVVKESLMTSFTL